MSWGVQIESLAEEGLRKGRPGSLCRRRSECHHHGYTSLASRCEQQDSVHPGKNAKSHPSKLFLPSSACAAAGIQNPTERETRRRRRRMARGCSESKARALLRLWTNACKTPVRQQAGSGCAMLWPKTPKRDVSRLRHERGFEGGMTAVTAGIRKEVEGAGRGTMTCIPGRFIIGEGCAVPRDCSIVRRISRKGGGPRMCIGAHGLVSRWSGWCLSRAKQRTGRSEDGVVVGTAAANA